MIRRFQMSSVDFRKVNSFDSQKLSSFYWFSLSSFRSLPSLKSSLLITTFAPLRVSAPRLRIYPEKKSLHRSLISSMYV